MRPQLLATLSLFCATASVQAVFLAPTTPGFASINGQEGWSGGGVAILSEVQQNVSNADGNLAPGALFISNYTTVSGNNAYPNNNFQGWVFSPSASGALVGQTGTPGATGDSLSISFFFKSVSTSASGDGTNMEFDFGNNNTGGRGNFLAVTNDADGNGGLKIRYAQSAGIPGGVTAPSNAAFDLDRSVWHKIEMIYTAVPGSSTLEEVDTVTVLLDSTPILNSILSYEGNNIAQGGYVPVNGLMMRSGISGANRAFANTDPQGLYVDDLNIVAKNGPTTVGTYSTDFSVTLVPPVPEPATWAALAGVAALGLALYRRRR